MYSYFLREKILALVSENTKKCKKNEKIREPTLTYPFKIKRTNNYNY